MEDRYIFLLQDFVYCTAAVNCIIFLFFCNCVYLFAFSLKEHGRSRESDKELSRLVADLQRRMEQTEVAFFFSAFRSNLQS